MLWAQPSCFPNREEFNPPTRWVKGSALAQWRGRKESRLCEDLFSQVISLWESSLKKCRLCWCEINEIQETNKSPAASLASHLINLVASSPCSGRSLKPLVLESFFQISLHIISITEHGRNMPKWLISCRSFLSQKDGEKGCLACWVCWWVDEDGVGTHDCYSYWERKHPTAWILLRPARDTQQCSHPKPLRSHEEKNWTWFEIQWP